MVIDHQRFRIGPGEKRWAGSACRTLIVIPGGRIDQGHVHRIAPIRIEAQGAADIKIEFGDVYGREVLMN